MRKVRQALRPEVLSDECELVSVCRYIGWFMQHKAVAIRQVQRRV